MPAQQPSTERLVLPQYGPSLAELYGSRFRALPLIVRGLICLAILAIVAALGWKLFIGEKASTSYVQAQPVAFNFRYAGDLSKARPEGNEFVRLVSNRDGLFTQSFAVAPLKLPAKYRGLSGAVLPSYASSVIPDLRRRFAGFEVQEEGRIFVNQVLGYSIVFSAKLGERALFGRYVLLPGPELDSSSGVTLLLLSTPAAGTYSADTVGSIGATKLPFRSFRLGVDSP